MALSTYSELQAAIASWLARTDLTDQIPSFIALAEARINRELRVREMVTDLVGTTNNQIITIPDDFIEVVRFVVDSEPDSFLEYRPIEDASLRTGGVAAIPSYYSVFGPNFVIYPAPSGDYTYAIGYYAKVPALSDFVTTNWLLQKAPDLYLYGALVHSAPFLVEDERVTTWNSIFEATKASLHAAESRTKRTNGPWRARVLA